MPIADQFLSELNELEISPPFYNAALFIQSSGWNTNQYLNTYYKDSTPYPLLLVVKAAEGIMYLSAAKHKRLAEEIFKEYWANTFLLKEVESTVQEYVKVIDVIYNNLTYDKVSKTDLTELFRQAKLSKDAAWNMNARCLFSIYFDKEMCSVLLKEVGSSIESAHLDMIWDKATVPVADSFEKRRAHYALQLIAQGLSWDQIAEQCQYFESAYNKIENVEAVKTILQSKYGSVTKDEAVAVLQNDQNEKQNRLSEYQLWLTSLTPDEQKLVTFIQNIIEWRDVRKDYIAKTLAVTFRIAQRVFAEANVSEKLIYFSRFDEIIKGVDYIQQQEETFQKRTNGYALYISYNGDQYEEYGTNEEIKRKVEQAFLQQSLHSDSETVMEVKGQVGSPGIVTGVVRVIKNIETEQHLFKPGEILVTGMTRPEFVPLMKHAIAVVTDEGGITCHAAIVSRELKIPCVIGTKIATQVLKDGETVEVNAKTGVITKLAK